MIFLPFFAAAIASTTAFLQAEAAWWKGPLASLALAVIGFAIAYALSDQVAVNTALPPAIGLVGGALFCALVVTLGVVVALVFRRFLSAGRIAGLAFAAGFVGCIGLMIVV